MNHADATHSVKNKRSTDKGGFCCCRDSQYGFVKTNKPLCIGLDVRVGLGEEMEGGRHRTINHGYSTSKTQSPLTSQT
jgi:hypothetical protein